MDRWLPSLENILLLPPITDQYGNIYSSNLEAEIRTGIDLRVITSILLGDLVTDQIPYKFKLVDETTTPTD